MEHTDLIDAAILLEDRISFTLFPDFVESLKQSAHSAFTELNLISSGWTVQTKDRGILEIAFI